MIIVKIRKAITDDANAIFNIHRNAILNIKDYLYSQEIKQAWAPQHIKQAEQIITDENHYTIVAEYENKVIGFASASNEEFELLFVDPEFQNLGVASKLLKNLEENVTRPIKLKASKNAVEFYRKQGYKITSKFNVLVNNQIFDRFWARKD